jgi:hypothetical protein
MTIKIDDAGYGDLLFGAIIGAYRTETEEFIYDAIDVKYFQRPLFSKKEYLSEAGRITINLVERMNPKVGEKVELCRGDILDKAAEALVELLGEEQVLRIKVEGEAQKLTELAFINELRNLGYEPIKKRTDQWAKNFFHMLRWLNAHPEMLKWAKTGWPRLKRYKLFRTRSGR